MCAVRNQVRKAIDLIEFSLSRDVKGNKEGSYTDLSGERKIRWVLSSWEQGTCLVWTAKMLGS